ncbi:sialate O-acetylesterase [uncultured Victivallis sp.]|uniref:sialate O-acetylesterase n=1 Tax=uncultured Victivallis sp. TaxID=354118 RepID=UPI0025D97702|nr:sialate O-acetylesterase [uncultured Victivallis sp.]
MGRKVPLTMAFAAAILLAGCTTRTYDCGTEEVPVVPEPEVVIPARAETQNSFQSIPMAQKFSVRKVYGDHMVLQRNCPIRICGTADPGKVVLVGVGSNSVLATAGENGLWEAVLPAMEAGGPYMVSVTGAPGSEPIVFKDVLIGDVWLATGQSNMEMPVYSKGRFWSSRNGKEEAAQANYPKIRLYNATSKKYVSPGIVQSEVVGPGWKLCTPETVAPFSAVAFYFGRQLQKDLDVPIGLISASWGGTAIQPWISYDAYARAGRTKEMYQIDRISRNSKELQEKYEAAVAEAKKKFLDWQKRFYETYSRETAAAASWKNSDFNDSDWETVSCQEAFFPGDVDGVAWFRKTIDLPANWAGKPLKLSLGAIDDCDETYFNGVKVGATGTDVDNYWSVDRNYQIPGNLVKAGRNVIAIRVSDQYGTGGLMGNTDEMFLQNGNQKISIAGDWRFKLEFAADLKRIGLRPDPQGYMTSDERHPSFPATLYNSMLAPWTVYPICGVLWYQGESNAGDPADYINLQKLLISDLRTNWHNPKLPFLFVQLSGFEKHSPDKRLPDDYWVDRAPGNPAWAAFREAQTATLSEPYTGMAVCIDAGDHSDIHPANKQVVGYRLAKEAERIHYGKNIISAGPSFRSMKIEGDKAILSFDNVGGGLVASGSREGKLNCFAIAGKDGKFVWADAVIDGDKVVVSSPSVKEPAAVRYGWVSYAGNLNFYNKDGFPACPFRTDKPDYITK